MNEYKKQLTWAKVRVGLVVSAALAVVFFSVLFAGSLENLFSHRVMIYATFDDVKGLQAGAPVWFSGVQVGTVTSLELTSGAKIKVPLSIKRDILSYLKQDSPATILTLGLLGDKYIELRPGTKDSPGLRPGDTIGGAPQPGITEDVAGVVSRIQNRKGTFGRLLEEDTLYRDLAASARDIRLFAATIETSRGTLDKIIKDPALYERFLRASQSLDAFTQKLSASKGTVSRLIEDESLYNNLNTAAIKLNTLLDSVNTGQGTVGRLVTDRELAEQMQKTLKEVDGLVKDIKTNPRKYFKISLF